MHHHKHKYSDGIFQCYTPGGFTFLNNILLEYFHRLLEIENHLRSERQQKNVWQH